MRHKVISIEGNIGAGKTTLAGLVAQATGRTLVLEQFEQNPFLADFYAHPEQYAFHTELFFLAERYEQWRQMPDVSIVSDYSLAKSLYFAEITLKGPELDTFNRIYQGLTQMVKQPDLTLYLYRSTTQLSQHIQQRGRVYEQDIEDAYLEQIQDNYLRHLRLLTHQRIVLLDARNKDFQEDSPDLQWLLGLLEQDYEVGITEV